MSLAELAKKAKEHNKGKAGWKAAARPERKPGMTQENYRIDYNRNAPNSIETFTIVKRFLENDIGRVHGTVSTIIGRGEHYQIWGPDRPEPDELNDPMEGPILAIQYKTEYARSESQLKTVFFKVRLFHNPCLWVVK